MKVLLTGNEAVARGVYEAGVRFASAYPGTPSTEIMENISTYKEILSEWAPNEKVALETAIGASIAGARSFASMKHVGLNVAADPLFTWSYVGATGGNVILTADEPGMFSSQNEQDNRNYAKFAKIPMMEPADSQESKDMVLLGYEISEAFATPVLIRSTTRVCHSKSAVELLPRQEKDLIPYEKNILKRVMVPACARVSRGVVEERTQALKEYSENTPLNYTEYHDKKVGVIASGVCFKYAKEVWGDNASYLKLGFTYPLPAEKIKAFCQEVDTLYVIEENDPYIEEAVRILGFDPKGYGFFPAYGEKTPDVIRKAVFGKALDQIAYDKSLAANRPPALCAGCPHRGVFMDLSRRKNIMIAGDIGCYTLASGKPYQAMDTCICMGGSFSTGHGAQKVFNLGDSKRKVVTVLGDSTFFHTGINSLINTVYNQSNTVNIILDNRITGMTGHQENPGSGFTSSGSPSPIIDIESVVKALGVRHIRTIDPNDLKEVKAVLDEFLQLEEPSVIITRWPCVLKRLSPADKEEFVRVFQDLCVVNEEKCIGCKACVRTGCPAIHFQVDRKKSWVDPAQCVGCTVCMQVCPVQAISKEVR